MIVLRFCFQTTKIALGSKTSREKAAQSVSLDLVFCFLFGKLQPNMIFTRDRVYKIVHWGRITAVYLGSYFEQRAGSVLQSCLTSVFILCTNGSNKSKSAKFTF
jgi:hypothetical protein